MKVSAHLEVAFVACWVIIAEKSGYQNLLLKTLSRGGFIRYAKTSYAMFLIGPIVTMLIYGLLSGGSTLNSPEIVSISKFEQASMIETFSLSLVDHHFSRHLENHWPDFFHPHCTF